MTTSSAAIANTSVVSLSRRAALAAGTASLAFLSGASAFAQQPQPVARAKGPRVWLNLDQKELDDAYDQSKYAANIRQVIQRYGTTSAFARSQLGEPKRLSYGATPVEALDLFTTKAAKAPIHVFIHGGAWRVGTAKQYSFVAPTFVNAGAHCAVLDFTNVTQTKGDIGPMAEQCRRAIAWLHKNAASFGGDPDRIYMSGHSSGGHLAGVVAVTDWASFGAPADVVKGAVIVSGMYDLKPVRLSARSSYVAFTDAMEDSLSAQRHLSRLNSPVMIAYGSLETPEFQRQSRDFAAALKAKGKPVELIVGEHYNHFEIIETLANPYGLLGNAALRQMKLRA